MRSNDLAFSLHCNLMTVLCILQILIYKRCCSCATCTKDKMSACCCSSASMSP